MNRLIDSCFSYIIVDNDNGIQGYIKHLPALPHNSETTVRVFCCKECNDSNIVRLNDIKGKIVVYSIPHIFHDAIKKNGCSCGHHR